jgi:predicted transcriptional regulator
MKTLTVKIPELLDEKLRRKSKSLNQPLSEIVRRALRRELEEGTCNFAKLAAPFRGMFSGPADLSTREGYGNRKSS